MQRKKKDFDLSKVVYRNIQCSDMTFEDINAASTLFSNNYGYWSDNYPDIAKRGKRIKLSPNRIKSEYVDKKNRYVAFAYYDDHLIGQVFYIDKRGERTKNIIWIQQLVVDEAYRNRGIATKLLCSIWSPSNCYAWGLYTSSPMTIRALEKATWRRVDVELIGKKIDKLLPVANDIFLSTKWIDNYQDGIVNTEFYVDHKDLETRIKKTYKKKTFPFSHRLPEGYEWLAFVFNSQEPVADDTSDLDNYLEYSDAILNTAYSNMDLLNQSWAKHTNEEIDYFISSQFIKPKDRIIDIGCGIGRHTNELIKRGYTATGVDFSKRNIEIAKSFGNIDSFRCDDIRRIKERNQYDVVLCLYDIVGSYPDEKDNYKILNVANRCLKTNGIMLLSVMNMEYTRRICSNKIPDLMDNIQELLKLKGSTTMQSTGDVFDGEKMLIDEKTGIVYRKEQFISKDSLPAEYVIRDRRYSYLGIQKMLKHSGFSIETIYCFNSSDISKSVSRKDAKEIFVVAKKTSFPKIIPWLILNDKSDYWRE